MKEAPNLSQEEYIQQIRTLIWSNDSPNDMLALEIVKNQAFCPELLPDLLVIALTQADDDIKQAYQAYLKPHISPAANKAIVDRIGTRYNSYYSPLQILKKENTLSITQGLFTIFKRTGTNINEFLIEDDGSSPYRKEVFESFLIHEGNRFSYQRASHSYNINLPGLTTEEISRFLRSHNYSGFANLGIQLTAPKATQVPDDIFAFTKLKRLGFLNMPLTSFPERLFELKELISLGFQNVPLGKLPSDLSAFKKLEAISFRQCDVLVDDLSVFYPLKRLKSIDLNGNQLANHYLLMTPKALKLGRWYDVERQIRFPFDKFILFASALERSSLSQKDKLECFDKVKACANLNELPESSMTELLQYLSINYNPLRELCLQRLQIIMDEQKGIASLKKGANLLIVGNTNMTKTEIRNKLKEAGIQYSTTLSKEVTHILLGKNPKFETVEEVQEFKLINENQLQSFFSKIQPQYLEQASGSGETEVQTNLLKFLRSPDPSNALLAIEMLKSGGVPEDLLEELLVVQKTSIDSKVRAGAKKLLERYAPEGWLPLIRNKPHFAAITQNAKEQDINKKLKTVAKASSNDLAAMLSLAMYKVHGRGLRYILYTYKKPHEWRTKAFQAMMDETHFGFSRGLGFKNWKEKDIKSIILYNMKSPVPFPVDVLDNVEKIESMDLHNCKLDKLHISIGKFKNLKHLDCSCNFISKLPKTVSKLQNLESLNLFCNQFSEFPKEVLELKNLKKLDLRHMQINSINAVQALEITDEVKAKLPDCEILV